MTRPTYSKQDVEFHSDRGPSLPAINVKVYNSVHRVPLPLDLGTCDGEAIRTDSRFTHAWIERNISEREQQAAWECVIEDGWEGLKMDAEEIFGPHVKVWSQGRSGGWCVVEGLPNFDSWNALDLGKWRKFEKYAKARAADVPRGILDFLYFNSFLLAESNALQAAGME